MTASVFKLRRRTATTGQMIAGLVLLFWVLVLIFAPLLTPHNPNDFLADDGFAPVGFLGADYIGRDLFSRIVAGTRITLLTALAATAVAHLLGSTLGILASILGGWFDFACSRVVDVMLSLPKMIVALVVIAVVGSSIEVLVILAGVVYSASVFRIARSLAADVVVLDFVKVARARGESIFWLAFGEVVPNIAGPLAADFALRLSFAILFISGLSFLGLGVQPPLADWGGLVRENLSALSSGGLAPLYPAVAIASVAIALNVVVDAVSSSNSGKLQP